MTTKTLRALAKDYANGVLDKESYRKARDAYFRAVLSGTVKVEVIDYRPPVDIQDLDVTLEKTSVRPQRPKSDSEGIESVNQGNSGHSQSRQSAQPSTSPLLIVSIILLIIAAIGVSIALLYAPEKKGAAEIVTIQPDAADIIEEQPSVPQVLQPASPAETLIENFLQENNWSDSNLQQFKNDWQALTTAEQEQGLSSPMRVQLVNAIHQKLLEERALLGLGDTENVIARQHKLVDFATDLDINDPRLQVKTEN